MSVTVADWSRRLNDKAARNPFWLGLSIASGFLLIRCAFDGLFLMILGFPEGAYPLWRSDIWWPELVNASLIGYIPAVLVIARRGISRDLSQLRPRLPDSRLDINDIVKSVTGPLVLVVRAIKLIAIFMVIMYVFLDPSMAGGTEPSLTNPNFIWAMIRNLVFTWLVLTLIESELNATRGYYHMGRNLIEVDLLDIQSLSPFAHRGLRSALMWVIFSIIFSLYWLGEDVASQLNSSLLITILAMATAAFAVPLTAVHNNILSVKKLELEHLREEIRIERTAVIDEHSKDERTSPRLANLVTYYQLIDSSREWPIDAVNLLRFFVYLLVGLGSWLGGAIVERLLDSTLGV